MDAFSRKNGVRITLWVVAIIAVIVFAKWLALGERPDKSLYQVVLLDNSQAFYGQLHNVWSDYPFLTDVYYLQPKVKVDEFGNRVSEGKFTVIKRGNETHKPIDRMYFNKDHVIYWENVGEDSLVTQGIKAEKEVRIQREAAAAQKTALPGGAIEIAQ